MKVTRDDSQVRQCVRVQVGVVFIRVTWVGGSVVRVAGSQWSILGSNLGPDYPTDEV